MMWDFIKTHADTITIVLVVIGAWNKLDTKINDIDKRLTVIETVMLCNKMIPSYVVKGEEK
jgi:hypothetical protein